jgi:hypothetical protein
MTDYSAMTGNELVDEYNGLNPDKPLSKPWKSGKDKLIGMVKELKAQRAKEAAAEEPARTIRVASLELMCQVDYYEDKTKKPGPDNRVPADHPNARSVGLPYLDIIDLIKDEFPGAKTSAACLRWYAVKARVEEFGYEGYRLVSRRPRAKKSQ